jgi:hypothetical protein
VRERESKMNSTDDGYFRYDMKYAPLCIEIPDYVAPHAPETAQADVERAVSQSLQDSYKHGIKHDCAMLPCGMTVGEGAMMYFRALYEKRNNKKILPFDQWFNKLKDVLSTHFGADFSGEPNRNLIKSYNKTLYSNYTNSTSVVRIVKEILLKMGIKSTYPRIREVILVLF